MKNIKKLVSAVVVSVFAFSAVGCNMIAKTPEAISRGVVATVNGDKITRGDLDKNPTMTQILNQAKQQFGENYEKNEEAKGILKTQRQQILERMITEKVIEQKAKELKLTPDEAKLKADVDKQIAEIKKQQFGGDDKKFQEAIKKQNLTEEGFKEFFLGQMRSEQIFKNISEKVTKDVKVDDKKAQEYYNANKDKYTEKPNRIQLSHILVKTEDEAKKVKERLDKKDETFAKVAKEVSQDPGSKEKGGDLGFVNYVDSGFDPKFMQAAIALKEGEISAPVQTQFGYHIIKCIKKETYPVKKFESVKEEIKKQLTEEEKQKIFTQKLDEWTKASKITKNEKNLD